MTQMQQNCGDLVINICWTLGRFSQWLNFKSPKKVYSTAYYTPFHSKSSTKDFSQRNHPIWLHWVIAGLFSLWLDTLLMVPGACTPILIHLQYPRVDVVASSMDYDLEAFGHFPADGK